MLTLTSEAYSHHQDVVQEVIVSLLHLQSTEHRYGVFQSDIALMLSSRVAKLYRMKTPLTRHPPRQRHPCLSPSTLIRAFISEAGADLLSKAACIETLLPRRARFACFPERKVSIFDRADILQRTSRCAVCAALPKCSILIEWCKRTCI